ncbi:MAG: hypothetical protein KJ955_07400 [Nanoarchaeota archaeon]|nr:hypothetical protein [Nanoarchaeota archaeon]
MTLEDKLIEKYEFDLEELRGINLKTYSSTSHHNADVIREIAASPARFTIIGENHREILVGALVARLIETGNYSTLFLEALERGSYVEQGNSLKCPGGVYGWDPMKYDAIVRHAIERGVEVHGIDHPRHFAGSTADIALWANYILKAGKGKAIVLIGTAHAYRDKIERDISLPYHLSARGVDEKDMLTIISGNSRAMDIGQVHTKTGLPDAEGCRGIGDYLFVTGRTQEIKEEIYKIITGASQ